MRRWIAYPNQIQAAKVRTPTSQHMKSLPM
jgi:hypothetical protein